jgi:peptidoglycan hydrolase CwlO-like protein
MAHADDQPHRLRPHPRGAAIATIVAAALAVGALALSVVPAGGQGGIGIDAQRAKVRALEASLLQVNGEAAAAERAYSAADETVRRLERRIADNATQREAAARNFALAQERLGQRLRHIYAMHPPSMVEVLASSGSLTDAVDSYDMVKRVARLDRDLIEGFAAARTRLAELRLQLVEDRREAGRSRTEAGRRLVQLRTLAGERQRLLGAAQGALSGMEAAASQRAALAEAQRRAAIAAQPGATPDQITGASGPDPVPTSLVPGPGDGAAAPQGGGDDIDAHLARIAQCESGGNPGAISPGGDYRGKYQFSPATWAAVGGSGDPAAASEAEQDMRARILYERAGPGQWPVCSAR